MKKYKSVTEIALPRNNKTKKAIYEHEGRFYIKGNTSCFPVYIDGWAYTEVHEINGHWFKK